MAFRARHGNSAFDDIALPVTKHCSIKGTKGVKVSGSTNMGNGSIVDVCKRIRAKEDA